MGSRGILHTVLRLKYFPSSNFLEARIGAYQLYTWRSMWDVRDVLVAGVRWRVGKGHAISIVGHSWLPRLEMFQLIYRPPSLPDDTKVAALITDEHDWKEDLINTEFCPEDAACILGIDLRGGEGQDELVWHFERNGQFS
ncbi:UNVERIFIED_CONTAM: hypothetical protein Slati_4502000, partial [Sesamum latifolium]